MAQSHSAANLYQSVINDVITSVRESFLDESVDENVLLELKNLWVQKLEASKAVEQPQLGSDAAALDSKMAGARGGYNRGAGAGAGAGTQHVVINGKYKSDVDVGHLGCLTHLVVADPNRLVPVQITIPAQQGNPSSQPRALTVQVPAHALQTGGSSGVTLQQVLTQAITQVRPVTNILHSKCICNVCLLQALSLPPEHAAMYLQTQINQAFRLG